MDLFGIPQLLRSKARERTLPEPDAPIDLPRGPSMRTEPTVDDYGNDARETFYSLEEANEHVPMLNAVHDTGSVFLEETAIHVGSTPRIDDADLEEDSMVKKLRSAIALDKTNHTRHFVPRKTLLKVCNFRAVLTVLQQLPAFLQEPDELQKCAEYVCGPEGREVTDARECAREIFAILVLIDHPELIRDFRESHIVDNHLPLACTEGQEKMWPRKQSENQYLHFFHGTERQQLARHFYIHQWEVHVPFISRGAINQDSIDNGIVPENSMAHEYQLANDTIFPWSEYGKEAASGANGVVSRVSIHPDHHNFGLSENSTQRYFALKTLTAGPSAAKEVFEQELKAFRKNRNWEHVVELCATFQTDDKCMFLFPWAEGGNLDDMMSDVSRSQPPTLRADSTRDVVIDFNKWIFEQCGGLIRALLSIHEYLDEKVPQGLVNPEDHEVFGVHYDIKPANILHFHSGGQYGTLKLADFGLLKYHSRDTRTRKVIRYTYPPDHTYKCPEYDFCGTLSRKVDIWALGCVFAELLTWVIKGTGSVTSFHTARFCEITRTSSSLGNTKGRDTAYFTRQPKLKVKQVWSVLVQPSHMDGFLEEPILKRSVVDWISKLSSRASCGGQRTFLLDFLDQIRDGMLAVDREKRIRCKGMSLFFDECQKRGNKSDSYWMFPLGVLPESPPDIEWQDRRRTSRPQAATPTREFSKRKTVSPVKRRSCSRLMCLGC